VDNKEKSYRILLVVDEPSITQTFELGLRQYGFGVDTFNNPILALASYKPGNYDYSFIMNGFEQVNICFITA
jgi:DNA-binding response OmpR family regulator